MSQTTDCKSHAQSGDKAASFPGWPGNEARDKVAAEAARDKVAAEAAGDKVAAEAAGDKVAAEAAALSTWTHLCWAACLQTSMMAFLHCFWDRTLSWSMSLWNSNQYTWLEST